MTKASTYSLYIALIAALFFIPFLGGVHLFDWDEINFAEISREMIITGDYFRPYIDFQAFYQKPPLFFWLQVLAMKAFGINDFAARFPNAICGIITLVLLYNLGRKHFSHRFGLLWAGAYFGSVLPFLYFKSGIIDPFFNLFIFLGIYYFMLAYWKKAEMTSIQLRRNKWTYLALAGVFIGLAILTKGPVAYLIALLTFFVYWLYQRFRFYVNISEFLLFSIIAALVAASWFVVEDLLSNAPWKSWPLAVIGIDASIKIPAFLYEFIEYQIRLFSTHDAGHKGFPSYHFIVLLVGCFPVSVFFIRSLFKMPKPAHAHQADFSRWMQMLFWVVLLLFSIVQSKIVHYSSLCYFPLTFISAIVIEHLIEADIVLARWMKVSLWSIASLFIVAIVAMPIVGKNVDVLRPLLNDPFAQGNLEAEVFWSGLEVLPALFLLGLLVYFFRQFSSQQKARSFAFLFGGMGVFVMLTLYFFIARIEGYSQRAAVEFFEERIGEDCYFESFGYKTYAKLYYAQKQPPQNKDSYDLDWLLKGPIDKDVYIITKVHKTRFLKEYADLKEIGRKNGFVFYKRDKIEARR